MIYSFQPGFTDDEICLSSDQIDEVNDIFQLRDTGTDGVSFKHNQGFYDKSFIRKQKSVKFLNSGLHN